MIVRDEVLRKRRQAKVLESILIKRIGAAAHLAAGASEQNAARVEGGAIRGGPLRAADEGHRQLAGECRVLRINLL